MRSWAGMLGFLGLGLGIGLGVGVCLVGVFGKSDVASEAQVDHNVITAREIRLVDHNGKEVGRIGIPEYSKSGDPSMEFYHPEGAGLILGFKHGGRPFITLLDDWGGVVAEVGPDQQ